VAKEVMLVKIHANHLIHVPLLSNILVFMTLYIVVYVDTAHKDLDGLSELIDSDVIELKNHVTASQDLMNKSGNVLDAQWVKEVQPLNLKAKL
jgi:hypothetical protein